MTKRYVGRYATGNYTFVKLLKILKRSFKNFRKLLENNNSPKQKE
jgi:hypothetical protein